MAIARRSNRRRYVLFVVVLSALTLITLDTRNGRSGPIGAMGRAAHTILSPVQGTVDSVTSSLSDWWHGVTDSGDLKSQNRNLRRRVQELEGQQRTAQQAIDENEKLRALDGLDSRYAVKRVNARIVGRDPGNFDSTLQLDYGSERGIAKDMPVIGPDGSLVGTIIDVGRGWSTVRVLTDPEFHIGVQLPAHPFSGATTGIADAVVGEHELVDADIDPQKVVQNGDMVVTSPSRANPYPPDIPIGSVTSVEKSPSSGPQHVFIKPYTDLGGLEYVSVLLWVQGQGPVVITTTTTTSSTTSTTTTTVGH
jgi:rod shape-determining protein MreC